MVNKDLKDELKGKNYFEILENTYDNDLEKQEFKAPLIFRNPKPEGKNYYQILSISKEYIHFGNVIRNILY